MDSEFRKAQDLDLDASLEEIERVASVIVDAAIEVHREIGGPGLLESMYEASLEQELLIKGCRVQRQVHLPAFYKGEPLGEWFKVDMIVNGIIIIENKVAAKFHESFREQTLTYLRQSKLRLGFLLNFGEKLMHMGITRVVNGL